MRAHLEGPLRLPDLREQIGGAAQTTLRGQVGNLRSLGALQRHVRGGMPYTVENELTDIGRGMLDVADALETWLSRAPQGPVAFGSEPAKGAIRALVAGWGSTMLRALAARPLSLTELDSVIPDISYPSLERRLSAMRAARQVETVADSPNQVKPYTVTEWTRQAVGPLAASSRCECEHLAEVTEAPTRIDVEAAFLLAVPLVALPVGLSGSCLLAIGSANGASAESLTGVQVEVRDGDLTSCVPTLEADPATLATGSPKSWLTAILDGHTAGIRFAGPDAELAAAVASGIHVALS